MLITSNSRACMSSLKPAKRTTYAYGSSAKFAANHHAPDYGWNVTRCLTAGTNPSSALSTAASGGFQHRYNYGLIIITNWGRRTEDANTFCNVIFIGIFVAVYSHSCCSFTIRIP